MHSAVDRNRYRLGALGDGAGVRIGVLEGGAVSEAGWDAVFVLTFAVAVGFGLGWVFTRVTR